MHLEIWNAAFSYSLFGLFGNKPAGLLSRILSFYTTLYVRRVVNNVLQHMVKKTFFQLLSQL